MARNPVTALPDDPLVSVRRVMVEQNIGRVPIIGKDGKLTGIITRTDILRHLDLPEPLSPAPSTGTLRRSNNNTALSLENLQPLLREGLHPRAQKILNQARHLADREKTEIYLVGGTIRDLLLGYPPEKDLDLVVIGDAPAFTEKLRQVLGGRSRIHAQFGTASLSFEDGLHLDLVTAREEFYDAPAALPRVESAGLKKDLFRRDFSINTMACSLAADDYGRLIDFFNGRRDLHKGRIRSLYRLSFVDDPLRILRAVRFEQRFRFNIEPETMSLIGQAVKDRLLERVNRQRLNSELRLIYREPSPLANLQRCSELSMLPQLYPGIDPGPENWRLLQHLEETLERVDNKGWFESLDRELVYLSGLLHGLDYTARSAIIIKLNLSRERAFNLETSGSRSLFILEQLRKENLGPSAVVEALEGQSPETVLLAMTLAAEKAVRERIRTYLDSLRHIQPQITGKDLKALGLEPGPRYQEVLGLLRKAVLEGMVCSRQEERDFVSGYLDAPRGKEEL